MTDEFGKDLMDRSGNTKPELDHELKPKQDPNEKLISKELSRTQGERFDRYHDTGHSDPTSDDRYTVMPSTGDHTHTQKGGTQANGMPSLRSTRPTTSLKLPTNASKPTSSSGSRGMTTENYCKVYQQRQREQERLAQARKSMQSHNVSTASRKQNEEETNLRVRARSLIDQIQWWRGQFGQTEHEPHMITGMISSLEAQLHAIDPRYWP